MIARSDPMPVCDAKKEKSGAIDVACGEMKSLWKRPQSEKMWLQGLLAC